MCPLLGPMSRVSAFIIAAFVLAAPRPAEGQDLDDQRWRSPSAVEDTADQDVRATRLMPLAIIGSIAGTYFGAIAGDRLRFVGSKLAGKWIGFSVTQGTVASVLAPILEMR